MSRREELLKVFAEIETLPIVKCTIDEVVYMEGKLSEYKGELDGMVLSSRTKEKYSFYNKLYLDTMAKYNTAIQTLLRIASKEDTEEESPLRAFLEMVNKGDN